MMVPEFEDVVLGLSVGELSRVFRTPFGFHVAVVQRKQPPRRMSFEEARGNIERAIAGGIEQLRLRAALDGLRSIAVISRGAP